MMGTRPGRYIGSAAPSEPFSTGRGCVGGARRPPRERGPLDPPHRLRGRGEDDRGVRAGPFGGRRRGDDRERGPPRARDRRVPVRPWAGTAPPHGAPRHPAREHSRGREPTAVVRASVRLHEPLPSLVRSAGLARTVGISARTSGGPGGGPYGRADRTA